MNQIIVDTTMNETRLALIENNELVELYIERKNNKRIVGNIYKGRVTNVLPGMQAAFVDIGLEKNSFLYVKDAVPQEYQYEENETFQDIAIKDLIKPGQEIIVQVTKEPIGTKGARVTTHITLPGRYLVLMPYTDYLGVSRRITSEEERIRLKKAVEEVKPQNMGVIVRTVAEGKNKEAFNDDIKFLLKLWQKIEKEKKLGFAPRMIYKDFDLVDRTIRDIFSINIDKFVMNNTEDYKGALELVDLISPALKSRIELYDEELEIFQYYNIETQFKNSILRKIWLKSGGYIVIDSTEALTVIDVNTGKYVGSIDLEDTVFKTNLEAAQEIAKQLRLRDIGGIIIVDFIDMTNEDYVERVLQALEQSLNKDRTKTKILGMTSLGLVEITRKKVRQRLESLLLKQCPCCEGTGKVLNEEVLLFRIEKEVKRTKIHTNAEAIVFEVNPDVYDGIFKDKSVIKELEEEYGIKIWVLPKKDAHFNDLHIKARGKIETMEKLVKEI
ncbi:Rne/Rng family ribonuclease [Clostridium formicaceticum]|uniref:Ribonuclease G n=1 Tax=Clostridium formicaceticum TaxID=1497 RepID=A0AAC9RJP4_9CLOT|nr:Rne/Rng family ribonuclease [Clostridium formicaceticum]AOY76861.1 ribonuclease E/G [Clostridium formicaceticum]ARE87341.1 Ribonuclease G [Clostridium formicaceticum]